MQMYFKGYLKGCKIDEQYFLLATYQLLTENIINPLKV